MIQIDTGLGLALLSIAITFWAWYNGRQTKKLLKQWRDEDMYWRQEWRKYLDEMQKRHDEMQRRHEETLANMQKHHDETLANMQKHHDETIRYIASLISAKSDEVKEDIRKERQDQRLRSEHRV